MSKVVHQTVDLVIDDSSIEGKALEKRSALTPSTAKELIDAGFTINVERSPVRVFDDEEFEKVGATLVEEGSWPDAPAEHIIIGLKELPVAECEMIFMITIKPPSFSPSCSSS